MNNWPAVIIGISKRSYGYYHLNGRADEGVAQFLATSNEDLDETLLSAEARGALNLPGNAHTRSWLLAALVACKCSELAIATVNLRRYRRIQAVETATATAEGKSPLGAMTSLRATFPAAQRRLADMVFFHLRGLSGRGIDVQSEAARLRRALGVYLNPKTEEIDLGHHTTILDAYAACAAEDGAIWPIQGLLDDLALAVEQLAAFDGVGAKLAAAKRSFEEAKRRIGDLETVIELQRLERERLEDALAASKDENRTLQVELGMAASRADLAVNRNLALAADLEAALQTVSELQHELWPGNRFLGAVRALRRGAPG